MRCFTAEYHNEGEVTPGKSITLLLLIFTAKNRINHRIICIIQQQKKKKKLNEMACHQLTNRITAS